MTTERNDGTPPPFDKDRTVVRPRQRQGSRGQSGRLLKNRFILEERIGSGAMGDVYRAKDLRQEEAGSDPYLALSGAAKTRSMPSPNIVITYDYDRDGDTHFIGMEMLEGVTLDRYLGRHRRGVAREEALHIIDGFCRGLMHAHDRSIVHSDFKPGNVFYTTGRVAKVLDFGIARAVQNPGTAPVGSAQTVFDPGSLGMLTPAYASYEMLTGETPSVSDDVFAAALVCYELLTGQHPFERQPADVALEKGLAPQRIPGIARGVWKGLEKALRLRRDRRTQSIEELHASLFREASVIRRFFGRPRRD